MNSGLQRARAIGDPWLLSYALALEGMHLGYVGEHARSIDLLREAVALSEQTGESFQGTFWLLNLAIQQYHVDPNASAEMFLRCAERAIEDENARAVAGCFEGLGWCLACAHAFEDAAQLLGAAEELRTQTSQPLLPQWLEAHRRTVLLLEEQLPERPACGPGRPARRQCTRNGRTRYSGKRGER